CTVPVCGGKGAALWPVLRADGGLQRGSVGAIQGEIPDHGTPSRLPAPQPGGVCEDHCAEHGGVTGVVLLSDAPRGCGEKHSGGADGTGGGGSGDGGRHLLGQSEGLLMRLRKYGWYVVIGVVCGVLLSFSRVNPYTGQITLHELVFQLSGSRGEFVMGLYYGA